MAGLGDRYTLTAELGRGGMAVVYRAQDARHGRDVAVKVMLPTVADAVGPDRFLREIETAARLQHPHIVPVFDSGEAAGQLYFVMPLIEGESLRARLHREGPLEVGDAVRIARQIADALSYAHAQGVIHRDLKPENIMLTRGHALLADFGIARAGGTDEATGMMTRPGTVMGTPSYMSPELATGEGHIGPPTDVYALGCVLFELLTGSPPFTGDSFQSILVKRVTTEAPRVRSRRPDVPAQLDDAIACALARDVSRRFATADAFASALAENGPPVGTAAYRALGDRSIAVLPFANVSADADNDFFSDGLTDELITDLSGVKDLRLISRNSSMRLKASAKPLPEIGRDLGVRYLLTGTVRKAGNALRITAQLVDADTDTPIWAEKYSGTLDDVFDVQERVSRAIMGALQVQLSSSEEQRLASRRISDPRAFELYLQARNELRRYGTSTEHAGALLQRAIEIEGNTPPLRALRAFMEFSKVRGGTSADLRPLAVAEAEARALIELVPAAPYGHALLGFVSYEHGDLRQAARCLTKAMELDPTDADVLFILCITLQAAGQIEPARRLARRFHDVDPLSPFSGAMLCCSEWFSGNIGLHVDAMERALAMDPDNPICNWALGYTYALMGRAADASRHAAWMRAHVPQLPYTAQLSALVHGMEGRRDKALEALSAMDVGPLDAHQTFHIAESYAMAGDTSRALALVEHAVDHGMYPYKFYAEYCPFMAPLRGNPEFDRIVAKAASRVQVFEETTPAGGRTAV
jgi:serine/threonine protein kinase/Flp pilus assembly protein TadD